MQLATAVNLKAAGQEVQDAGASQEVFGNLQRAFTGKIGRWPEAVRLELNRRLQNSAPVGEIAAWLNALPGVQAVVTSQFAGSPVTKQNISRWRQTG